MRNYLRSELYRNFNRMYFKVLTLATLGLALLGCLLLIYVENTWPQSIDICVLLLAGCSMLGAATMIMFVFSDAVTAEENKNNTLKNIISSGLSRPKIYLSKLIVSIILMICYIVIVFFGSIAIGYLLLGADNSNEFLRLFNLLGTRIALAAIPLWMGAMAIATLLGMFINKGSIFVCAYIGIFSFTGNILGLLGRYINPIFNTLRQNLISTQIGRIMEDVAISNSELIQSGLIGLVYLVVFAIIGVILMERKNA